jgi:predicted CoA-binding protein
VDGREREDDDPVGPGATLSALVVYNVRVAVVAVIGASSDRHKFGNKALRAFRQHGDTVIPINPNASTVEGERAYASVLDYPGKIDEATFYVQPEIGVRLMDEIAKKGITTVWLNPGADAPEVVARAKALGIITHVACSIVGIGDTPSRY